MINRFSSLQACNVFDRIYFARQRRLKRSRLHRMSLAMFRAARIACATRGHSFIVHDAITGIDYCDECSERLTPYKPLPLDATLFFARTYAVRSRLQELRERKRKPRGPQYAWRPEFAYEWHTTIDDNNPF